MAENNYKPREAGRHTTVLFADVTGSTRLYEQAGDAKAVEAIARCIDALRKAAEACGGRVVKTIGDEVMFVDPDISNAAHIALRLTERSAVDELLPDARAGLAAGSVVSQEGDYYGPVVNLASRLVELARPGTVLVSSEVRDALADDPAFVWRRLRSRRIRDIGRVEVWALERAREPVREP
jgi:adenylate cyclase